MLLALLAVLCAGCSYRFMPVQSPQIRVTEEYGIVESDEYTIIAANRYWSHEPQELSNSFLTFSLVVQYTTKAPLNITPRDVLLLDERGNQMDIVPVESLTAMYKPQELVVTAGPIDPMAQDAAWNEWLKIQQNLSSESFHFGQIAPGARKQGFIFFHRLPSSATGCTLQVLSSAITFARQ
jgi:hypothetical protein